MGLTLEEYWKYPPVTVKKYVEAYEERLTNEMRMQDRLNHMLGKYIAIAVNKPQAYPSKPFLDKAKEREEELKPMTAEEMEKRVRKNTIILGGNIK